jgi:hypothetical protein
MNNLSGFGTTGQNPEKSYDDAGFSEDIDVSALNVKRFPSRQKYTMVFGGKTKVG